MGSSSSVIINVADAVVSSLNNAVFSQSLTVERKYLVKQDLDKLQDLQVSVVASGKNVERMSRSGFNHKLKIDIGIQKKFSTDTDNDALMDLVDEIIEHFKANSIEVTDSGNLTVLEIDNDMLYAPEHMDKTKVFTSVITLTYQM